MVGVLRSRHHGRHPRPPAVPHPARTGPASRTHEVRCDSQSGFPGRPGGVTADAGGTVYLSVSAPATIWQMSLDGRGVALRRRAGGSGPWFSPAGIASTPDGGLVFADATAHRICSLDSEGSTVVLAGGVSGFRDGPAAQAAFRFPRAVAVGVDGTIFVADTGNDRIRRISPDGRVSTVAGSIYDYGDGAGPHARFRRPSGLAIDRGGMLYVADTGNNALRRLMPDGQVDTVAGGPPGGHGDGAGRSAGLRWPAAVAVGDDGDLWVADYGNSALRSITPAGATRTVFDFAGLGRPTAVAALPGRRAVVAGSALDDHRHPTGFLVVIGDAY